MDLIDFFDEKHYLADHPSVAAAAKEGKVSSGLRHYVLRGASEGRKAVADDRMRNFLSTRSLDKMPPDHLIQRVHGSGGPQSFSDAGKMLAFDLDACMQMAGVHPAPGAKVLDFGCGPGRVAQWFQKIHPAAKLHGCDIDPDPIAWANENLDGVFEVNPHHPPLPFDGSHFDLVFSVSVFTHLPEDMQFEWLAELRRVTKPGGFLLLSIHGANLASRRAPLTEGEKVLETKGFLYRKGNGVNGLPDFYQNTFHSTRYVYEQWSHYFEIRFVLKRGLNGHQDIVICRAPD